MSDSQVIERVIPLSQAALRLGVCVRTVWRMVADGTLPKPVPVGTGRHKPRRGFLESDLDRYFKSLNQGRAS